MKPDFNTFGCSLNVITPAIYTGFDVDMWIDELYSHLEVKRRVLVSNATL